jgi:hypothetical protein
VIFENNTDIAVGKLCRHQIQFSQVRRHVPSGVLFYRCLGGTATIRYGWRPFIIVDQQLS